MVSSTLSGSTGTGAARTVGTPRPKVAMRPAHLRAALRPKGFDDLGLRQIRADRLLPFLVAAMTFLAALALAGAVGAAALAEHWHGGAAAALTVQVPRPAIAASAGESRLDRTLALLRATPGIAQVRALTDAELADLLRPWLGTGAEALSLPLPAVLEVHLAPDSPPDMAALATRLTAAVPGAMMEGHGAWVRRLAALAWSLQTSAWLALAVVAAVAAAVVAIATRAGLSARRTAIELVHGLGATDGYIAARFARRTTALAGTGAAAGALAALPVLVTLAVLGAPFAGAPPPEPGLPWLLALPAELWLSLPVLPLAAAAIGFGTAQFTVRRWLRRLP